MIHLYPNFLTDESEYAETAAFWEHLWAEIPSEDRDLGGWRSGWFAPQPIKDANPIFTAVSEDLGKGIRSVEAAQIARKLMSSWVVGAIELANTSGLPDGVTTISTRRTLRGDAPVPDFDSIAPAA